MDARLSAAALLSGEMRKLHAPADLPLVVDTLSNAASLAYGALPERIVIIKGGIVRFIGGKGPEQYSIDAAREALQQIVGRQQ